MCDAEVEWSVSPIRAATVRERLSSGLGSKTAPLRSRLGLGVLLRKDSLDWPALSQRPPLSSRAPGTGLYIGEGCNKVAWVLQDWANFGPATAVQMLDEPGIPEKPGSSARRSAQGVILSGGLVALPRG